MEGKRYRGDHVDGMTIHEGGSIAPLFDGAHCGAGQNRRAQNGVQVVDGSILADQDTQRDMAFDPGQAGHFRVVWGNRSDEVLLLLHRSNANASPEDSIEQAREPAYIRRIAERQNLFVLRARLEHRRFPLACGKFRCEGGRCRDIADFYSSAIRLRPDAAVDLGRADVAAAAREMGYSENMTHANLAAPGTQHRRAVHVPGEDLATARGGAKPSVYVSSENIAAGRFQTRGEN